MENILHGTLSILLWKLIFLSVVDYVSKLVEAKATRTDDAKSVVSFIKIHIFIQFRVPRATLVIEGHIFVVEL